VEKKVYKKELSDGGDNTKNMVGNVCMDEYYV
jgi:hypothetical protein